MKALLKATAYLLLLAFAVLPVSSISEEWSPHRVVRLKVCLCVRSIALRCDTQRADVLEVADGIFVDLAL